MSSDLGQARLVLGGAAACAAAFWLSLLLTRAPLADLAAARAEHRLYTEALARGPVAPSTLVADGGAIVAPDRVVATTALGDVLRARALKAGLLVESQQPAVGGPGAPAELTLSISGSEDALLRFVADIESDRPLIRFRRWRFERSPAGGALRFTGSAVALWQPAR